MSPCKRKAKVVIALNTAWNLVNFRAGLIKALAAAGYEVVALAPADEYVLRLEFLGCHFVPLPMDNKGTHPGRDLLLLWRFYGLLKQERPDVYLGYTVKPNIYGSLAAHALGIPVVNNIAGLGAVFIRDGWLNRLVRLLYRLALARSAKVFFQNDEDKAMFVAGGLVNAAVTDCLPGSGIDLKQFVPVPLPNKTPIRFLLIARMLWDKGVGEFVEAARLLKQAGVQAEFCLLGFLDVQNPAAISRAQMESWTSEGGVRYLGVSDIVREEIAQADCVVLPSYREGTPRSLLEAAAMARPIVTTDAVGCRGVVDDGVNGYLCNPKDAVDLAQKMKWVVEFSPEERTAMGLRGRAKVEREFDEQIVIAKYLKAIDSICGQRSTSTTAMGPTECADCGATIDEPGGMSISNRTPCSVCGSTNRNMSASVNEVAKIREKIGMKQKRPGYKRPVFESVSGDDVHKVTGQWNKLTREIDRENGRYKEVIVNPETGEVLRHCEEPLAAHVNRGYARPKSDK